MQVFLSLHKMHISMHNIPINRLKAVLAESKKQVNGLQINLINQKLQFRDGVGTKYNLHWKQ